MDPTTGCPQCYILACSKEEKDLGIWQDMPKLWTSTSLDEDVGYGRNTSLDPLAISLRTDNREGKEVLNLRQLVRENHYRQTPQCLQDLC